MTNQPTSNFSLNPNASEFVPSFVMKQPVNKPNVYQEDIDPLELEARCEAVVEILQDEDIRNHLNPYVSNDNERHEEDYGDQNCEDEEDLLEMMAMQEECRLEMMKFYIQSQNPSLFEEIYHDVSYPDNDIKTASKPQPDSNKTQNQQKPQQQQQQKSNGQANQMPVKDVVIGQINTDSSDYVPNKFANLSLNSK